MALNERLERKLTKILAKLGLDDDKIDEIVDEVLEATSEEVTPEGGNPEETPIPPSVEEVVAEEPAPQEEEPQELPPETPNVEVAPEGPTPGSIEDAVAGLVPESAPEEVVAPTPDQVPPTPNFEDPRVNDLLNEITELKKANEGLVARVGSLEDALKNAGVIEGSQTIGDERPSLPESVNNQGDVLTEVLNRLNGK